MKRISIDCKIIQNKGTYIVISAADKFEWTPDGKKGARVGTNYGVLKLPECEKVLVLVPDATPAFKAEDLDTLTEGLQFQRADFENLEVSAYVDRNGDLKFSAQATKILPIAGIGGVK